MIKKDVLKIKKKKEIMYSINQIPFKSHGLVIKGVSTYDYIIKDFDIIFKEITDKFLLMVGSSYHIIDFWINKYFYKGCVNKHNHPTDKKLIAKTGVFYFKQPKKGGDLVIDNKNINMKEEDIVIFNPDQFHWSEPNLSKQEKIIFSVNMVKNFTRKELSKCL